MKRNTIFFILILVAIVCFSAVFLFLGSQDDQKAYAEIAPILTEYLDKEGVRLGLPHMGFPANIENYTYNSMNVRSWMSGGYLYFSYSGNCYVAKSEQCVYRDIFELDENPNYTVHSLEFYTYVPLEGLALPCHISFDDTLPQVLGKMGIHAADLFTYTNALLTESGKECIILFQNNRFAFSLHRAEHKEDGATTPAYELHYTETDVTTQSDGRETTVARKLIFRFAGERNELKCFGMTLRERYKLD